MKTEIYHYTECGLSNVYLEGGFSEIQTDYGPATSVFNVKDLHKLIGLHIVNHVVELSPDEVRFLRSEMLLSQAKLSDLIGVGETTVRNWESQDAERSNIGKPAARVLRSLYLEYQMEDSGIRKMMDKRAEYERCLHNDGKVSFGYTKGGWSEQRTAEC